MTWQVAAAVLAAWCVAAGAAAQERPAADTTATRRRQHLVTLMRRRRWWAGVGLTGIGMVLHLAALSTAPLVLIQPLGVSGLLVAVWLAARWRGRRITAAELAGGIAVSIGLVGLVLVLPHRTTAETPTGIGIAVSVLTVLALAGLAAAVGPRLGTRARAAGSALAAGACFGVTAALARAVAIAVSHDPAALWHWRTAAGVVTAVTGAVLLQDAYRAGHFALSYAVLLLSDPLVAAVIGVSVMGEAMPLEPAASLALAASALAVAVGVVTLAGSARSGRPVNNP